MSSKRTVGSSRKLKELRTISKQNLQVQESLSEQKSSFTSTSTPEVLSDSVHQSKRGSLQASKPRSPPVLVAIRPVNVNEEKTKFFKSNFNYDPQFEYATPLENINIKQYENVTDKYLPQALQIIYTSLKLYGSYSSWECISGGRVMSNAEVYDHIKEYLCNEGMEDEISINISSKLLSHASMTRVKGRPTINIREGTTHINWIDGLLNHEIGTHYIRAFNNRKQLWKSNKKRKKLRLLPANPTEEGLASLSTQITREEPSLWRSAMMYYTIFRASKMSFSQLFNHLEKYVDCPQARWTYVMRAKRGQTDTSCPGCFAKDQVYLTGALQILKLRHSLDFLTLFRLGKVSYKDIDRLAPHAKMAATRVPAFLNDIEQYRKKLDYILKFNGLCDADLIDC